jgi:hypothetical protein
MNTIILAYMTLTEFRDRLGTHSNELLFAIASSLLQNDTCWVKLRVFPAKAAPNQEIRAQYHLYRPKKKFWECGGINATARSDFSQQHLAGALVHEPHNEFPLKAVGGNLAALRQLSGEIKETRENEVIPNRSALPRLIASACTALQ